MARGDFCAGDRVSCEPRFSVGNGGERGAACRADSRCGGPGVSRKGGGASQRISVQRPMVHVVSVGELGSGVLGLKWNSIVSLSRVIV